ncbi:hypothetical protein [Dictyobacter halimunensis]|uniref:hypothetical protein n=1 Tax=Dictyobacter halimunensis TaxID=3026934 RepID=UPI0030C6CE84
MPYRNVTYGVVNRERIRGYLANDYPAPLTLDGRTYATVQYAYWAMATTDAEARERIIHAQTPVGAQRGLLWLSCAPIRTSSASLA